MCLYELFSICIQILFYFEVKSQTMPLSELVQNTNGLLLVVF